LSTAQNACFSHFFYKPRVFEQFMGVFSEKLLSSTPERRFCEHKVGLMDIS
jgi:hypothetical protein